MSGNMLKDVANELDTIKFKIAQIYNLGGLSYLENQRFLGNLSELHHIADSLSKRRYME